MARNCRFIIVRPLCSSIKNISLAKHWLHTAEKPGILAQLTHISQPKSSAIIATYEAKPIRQCGQPCRTRANGLHRFHDPRTLCSHHHHPSMHVHHSHHSNRPPLSPPMCPSPACESHTASNPPKFPSIHPSLNTQPISKRTSQPKNQH